jgi:enoyl-CoA hydratase
MSDTILRVGTARPPHSLDRSKALHALTQAMCEAIGRRVLACATIRGSTGDPRPCVARVCAVILDHAEGRGFCAGGDVAMVRRSALEDGGAAGRAFFHAEYRMNHLLFT